VLAAVRAPTEVLYLLSYHQTYEEKFYTPSMARLSDLEALGQADLVYEYYMAELKLKALDELQEHIAAEERQLSL